MLKLIPDSVRLLLVLALCAAAGYAGLRAGVHQGASERAGEVIELHRQLAEQVAHSSRLEDDIAVQNQAVAVARAHAEGAEQARQRAQQMADRFAGQSEARLRQIEAMADSSCRDVLARYWELRQ